MPMTTSTTKSSISENPKRRRGDIRSERSRVRVRVEAAVDSCYERRGRRTMVNSLIVTIKRF
jgi:hypothetical protein